MFPRGKSHEGTRRKTCTGYYTEEIVSNVHLPEKTNEQKNTSGEREHLASGKRLEWFGTGTPALLLSAFLGHDTALSLCISFWTCFQGRVICPSLQRNGDDLGSWLNMERRRSRWYEVEGQNLADCVSGWLATQNLQCGSLSSHSNITSYLEADGPVAVRQLLPLIKSRLYECVCRCGTSFVRCYKRFDELRGISFSPRGGWPGYWAVMR